MRSRRSAVSKSALGKRAVWIAFVLGLIGSGVGIVELHVQMAVFGLIVASISGLLLLKRRADMHQATPPLVREVQRPNTEFHSQAA